MCCTPSCITSSFLNKWALFRVKSLFYDCKSNLHEVKHSCKIIIFVKMVHTTLEAHASNRSLTEEMNLLYRSRYMINTVFNAIFVVFGVLGNALVIYVYRTRLRKKRHDDRYYVVVLAATDLCHSMFSSSLVFAKNSYPLLFPSDALCKFLLYGTNVFFNLSLLLLLIVCVHRYRKICRPMNQDEALRNKNIGILIAVLASLVFNLPKLVYFKRKQIHVREQIHVKAFNGYICGSDMTMEGSVFFVGIMSKFWIAFSAAAVVVLAVLYIFVGRVVYRQMKQNEHKRKESERFRSQFEKSSQSNSEEFSTTSPKISEHHSKVVYKVSDKSITLSEKRKTNTKPQKSRSMSMISSLSSRVRSHRLTIMFIIITINTVLSYLPTYIFILFDSNDPTRWFRVSNLELQLFLFLRSLHAVGYVANPAIYAYYDSAFKHALAKMMCRGVLFETSDQSST